MDIINDVGSEDPEQELLSTGQNNEDIAWYSDIKEIITRKFEIIIIIQSAMTWQKDIL